MFIEFFHIFLIDLTYKLYDYIVYFKRCNKTRWFFLHSIINFIIVYHAIPDVYMCITDNKLCYKTTWNYNSIKVYNYATILHIYHCIFFKLTKDDHLHHFFMVVICGTLCYILKSIISSFALFFLTGLPGAIDYMLLYLVKRDKINIIINYEN